MSSSASDALLNLVVQPLSMRLVFFPFAGTVIEREHDLRGSRRRLTANGARSSSRYRDRNGLARRRYAAYGALRFIQTHESKDKSTMCRNIRTLANFDPPATEEEIRASALQFVRKLSGSNRPSKVNEEVFNRAVDEVAAAAARLLSSLRTKAPPRDRDVEREKLKAQSRKRFGREPVHSPIPHVPKER